MWLVSNVSRLLTKIITSYKNEDRHVKKADKGGDN
jgi:hypothetical protein